MCLVEIEGMPKLQAGCTLTAQDGMVVRTARTSAKAAEGQNATLEFILVNHPLDCPVCDKGGECPLQDLTFRYGPGKTRMNFEKTTFEKPIPISPTIALDRERCILCYRCTRFSEDVDEDGQLVARNRGAMSIITTFEDEPYSGPFTGNVTELCPVGALLPTQYRFEARPWEIQSVPTVCGMCPVGCNTSVDMREGKAKRVRARNHHEIDEGWLCDKGRFAFTHLRSTDRIVDPIKRVRRRGFEPVSWDDAIDTAEELLRAAHGRVVVALSGSETIEQAYALAKLVRQGADSHDAVLPEEVSGALDAYRLPLSAIADAQVVAVLGDVPLARERADRRPLGAEGAPERRADRHLRGRGRRTPTASCSSGRARAAAPACASRSSPRSSASPARTAAARSSCPRRRTAAASPTRGRRPPTRSRATMDSIGLLIVSGDEAAGDPNVRGLAERADAVIAISMFHGLAVGWADLVLPGTSYLERDGTYVNIEGRLQRLRRTAEPPGPDELEWLAELASRFDVALAPHAAPVFAEVSERCYGGLSFAEIGERAALRAYEGAPAHTDEPALPEPAVAGGGLRLVCYKPLFSGPAVERVEELQFQRPQAEVELSRSRRRAARHQDGRRGHRLAAAAPR